MKAIKEPTQAALAAALGIDPAMVSRHRRRGMPVHSIEAAQAWRAEHVRVRWKPEGEPGDTSRAIDGERAVKVAGTMLEAAGELLESGGDVMPLVPSIRQAMAAVPPSLRDRVLLPLAVMDVLTEDVARVLQQGDPSGLIYGALYPWRRTKGEDVDMGAFWYAVAAGEIRVRRSGTEKG